MKHNRICPKCDGRKLFHVGRAQQARCDAPMAMKNFHAAVAMMKTGGKGLLGGEETDIYAAGPYETLICAACGYAEWYLPERELPMLARMAAASGTGVRVVEPDMPKAPFR